MLTMQFHIGHPPHYHCLDVKCFAIVMHLQRLCMRMLVGKKKGCVLASGTVFAGSGASSGSAMGFSSNISGSMYLYGYIYLTPQTKLPTSWRHGNRGRKRSLESFEHMPRTAVGAGHRHVEVPARSNGHATVGHASACRCHTERGLPDIVQKRAQSRTPDCVGEYLCSGEAAMLRQWRARS